MYTSTLYIGRVRDHAAAYPAERPEAEEFPGEGVLRDLPRVPESEVPRVVARYAALRAWVLRTTGDSLAAHAEDAAAAHLASLPGDWPERPVLARLAAPAPEEDAAPLLLDIAARAEAAGHGESACAVLLAGYRVARRRVELTTAATLASALGAVLRRGGVPGSALWLRRGERLRRLAEGWPPPGPS